MDTGSQPQRTPADVLQRRAEKAWRFRDIEQSWTHFVWALTTTAQTLLLGIFAIVSALQPQATSQGLLVAVVGLTAIELGTFYVLSLWRRNIDGGRAAHFEASVRASELGKPYDNNEADQHYESEEYAYRKVAATGEKIAVVAFLGTVACVFWAIFQLQ